MSWRLDRYRVASDPLRSERLVELTLVLACMMLLAQLLWGAYRLAFPATPAPVAPAPESMRMSPLLAEAVPSLEQRQEIRSRPLFWEGRVPLAPQETQPAPAETAAQGAAKTLKGIKLAGIFGAGPDAGVIILNKGKKQRLMLGQAVDGWKLESVEPTAASFSNAGSRADLTLERESISAGGLASDAGAPVTRGKKSKASASAATQTDTSGAGAQQAPAPEGLVLGGGDRNRGKTKQ